MPAPLDDEIRGDWNNLKGTEYHLVYVLWLLLCRNARSVAFYRGNDLLANPSPPPAAQETSTLVPAIHVQDPEEDEWIKLKATRDPWTVTALLDENLRHLGQLDGAFGPDTVGPVADRVCERAAQVPFFILAQIGVAQSVRSRRMAAATLEIIECRAHGSLVRDPLEQLRREGL